MAPDSQPEGDEAKIFALTRGRFLDWAQRVPTPVLALGRSKRLFRVQIEGTGFKIEYGGRAPITGFITTLIVSASDPSAAVERGRARVADEWDSWGWREMGGDARLEVTLVSAARGRWRWRSVGGFIFYAGGSAEEDEG